MPRFASWLCTRVPLIHCQATLLIPSIHCCLGGRVLWELGAPIGYLLLCAGIFSLGQVHDQSRHSWSSLPYVRLVCPSSLHNCIEKTQHQFFLISSCCSVIQIPARTHILGVKIFVIFISLLTKLTRCGVTSGLHNTNIVSCKCYGKCLKIFSFSLSLFFFVFKNIVIGR